MLDFFVRGDYGATPASFETVLLALLLAFLLGLVMAWAYMTCHSGGSYSRAYVVSLVLMPVIVALVLSVLSNNLVTAFGLMAVFAIVRFRNILRDTLDTAYILAAIVVGMACGSQKYATAVVGCGVILLVVIALALTQFGRRSHYDLVLNLHWASPVARLGELQALLDRHAWRAVCAHHQPTPDGSGIDLSYRLLLRDPDRREELLRELGALAGVSCLASITAHDDSEI
ncbi:DUF4956 domain-containing protein [Opitutus sp. ER46]|uniref:DUF4956 domain-containing protein n=1 Tax=Opitutus sp. ER46 TaxID=2161864 RepID=UPI000D31B265|nr:DUF4956 domain-containing protein [Opitutus sp. ER46]PTX98452.1 hypothetical protein DB354_04070 [Opitutus sp. ER46]